MSNIHRPAVIIADVHHKKGSVWQILRAMGSKTFRIEPTLPILTTSPVLSEKDYNRCFSAFPSSAFITLPCDKDTLNQTLDKIGHAAHSVPRSQLLTIDDDPKITHYIQKGLSQRGFDVQETFNMRAALQTLKNQPIDTVLLDHSVNKDSGLEVIKNMKARNMDILTIVITSDTSRTLAHQYSSLGIDWFSHKPFSIDHIVDVITNGHHQHSLQAMEEILMKKLKFIPIRINSHILYLDQRAYSPLSSGD